jgi:PBSX family phage terminase large subunit
MFNTKRKLSDIQMQKYQEVLEFGIGYNTPKPYYDGTFKSAKAKRLIKDIMSDHVVHITVEGGKRGSKDVLAVWGMAQYYMASPDKYHLITGTSVDHAIRTVAVSDGFGLQFLLPHGYFTTENNRKVFRFLDYYGEEKEIHFFAGRDRGDSDSFKGISYGSHYANEAIDQHIDTIMEGSERTIASKWRKVIHTQNPKGSSNEYYEVYEKPKIPKGDRLQNILDIKEEYRKKGKDISRKLNLDRANELKALKRQYLESSVCVTVEELAEKEFEIWKKYQKERRMIIHLYGRKILNDTNTAYRLFEYEYDNPNGVKNGLYFRYHHFTMWDNPSVDEERIKSVQEGYDVNSVRYKRDILGLRASVDGAIWETCEDKNIFDWRFPQVTQLQRVIGIDYGMANDFVIIDFTIDDDNTLYAVSETRFKPKDETLRPTNELYANMVEEVINSRENGEYYLIYVDPSARPFINELLARGMSVKPANNTVSRDKSDDRKMSDKNPDKSVFGIWLVRDGFALRKIMIHSSCYDLINEIQSYVLDPKQLALGKEVPMKINDHGCDALRYVVNTHIRDIRAWKGESVVNARTRLQHQQDKYKPERKDPIDFTDNELDLEYELFLAEFEQF